MSQRLPFLLLTLVLLLPLLGLGWLGWRLGMEQEHAWQRELDQVLEQHLREARSQALRPLDAIARQVDRAIARQGYRQPTALAAVLQDLPFVEQVLILGPGGDRRYPGRRTRLSAEQRAFLERTHSLWEGKALLHVGDVHSEGTPGGGSGGGWLSWHWEQGMELLYWRRDAEHGVVAVSVAPVSLLADIVAALPEGDKDPRERIQLRDGVGRVMYQWGGYRPDGQQAPRLSLPLAPPLDSWALGLFFDDSGSRIHGGRLRRLQLAIGLVTLALVSIALGVWLYRELRQAQREAAERVNFVNQVSHELRTPLTNIRLYAELLEDSVADDPAAEHKLAVIIAESRRLGRLIGNVLSFARQQKKTLRLHRVETSLDELVTDTVEQFRPGLVARGIDIDLDCRCPRPIALDPDAVAGILGNLLSNAEKYAPGKPLRVMTRERGDQALGSPTCSRQTRKRRATQATRRSQALLIVQDQGPGIPRRYRERVFKPFFRVGDKVTEGVSGTGIGLSIARDLARMHGGDLYLVDSKRGVRFELVLPMTVSKLDKE